MVIPNHNPPLQSIVSVIWILQQQWNERFYLQDLRGLLHQDVVKLKRHRRNSLSMFVTEIPGQLQLQMKPQEKNFALLFKNEGTNLKSSFDQISAFQCSVCTCHCDDLGFFHQQVPSSVCTTAQQFKCTKLFQLCEDGLDVTEATCVKEERSNRDRSFEIRMLKTTTIRPQNTFIDSIQDTHLNSRKK